MTVTFMTSAITSILQYALDYMTTNFPDLMLDFWGDLLDVGTGTATLKFEDNVDAEVATLNLSNPACAAASGGSKAFNSVTSDSSATGGVVDHASFYDRNGAKVHEATVAVTGASITVPTLTFPAGAVVTVTYMTMTL